MRLNKEQLEAATTAKGPLLIVAGAGTGKTRVITQRIAHILSDKTLKANPSDILALTFSKKAAQEMLERVEDLVGEHKDEIWISTFHAFCHRVLRDHALEAGISSRFNLLDRVGQWIFFRNILPKLELKTYFNIADPSACIDAFLNFIGKAKNELVTPEEYAKYVKKIENPEEKQRQEEVLMVYEKYQEFLKEESCLDFGDLISATIKLFKDRPDVLSKYQDRFRYILVDEFQDTNISQIELICLLASKNKNICVVGDDDQGIYRFRGASYASFVRFKENFSGIKTLRLEQNYRTTKTILSASESLIKNNNPDRYDPDKNLFTKNEKGDAIEIIYANDFRQEARAIIGRIKDIIAHMPEEDRDYSQIAVLYRAHSHKTEILDMLRQEEIPYTIVGGMGLFEQEEIKDVISYLKAIDDPDDSISLFRVLSNEKNGFGLDEILSLNRQAKQKQASLYTVLQNGVKSTPATKQKIKAFMDFLNELAFMAQREDVGKVAYCLLDKTKFLEELILNPSVKNENKILNISRFYKFINNFIRHHKDNSLSGFLRYLKYYKQAGGDIAEQEEAILSKGVQLMTVHQAKGLEFPYVFVISMMQGRFPTRRRPEPIGFPAELMKEDTPSGDFHLQEERRLCYVALTRACKKLFISCIRRRYQRPSVFIKEIASGVKTGIKQDEIAAEEGLEYHVEPSFSAREIEKLKVKRHILESLDSGEFTEYKGLFAQYSKLSKKRDPALDQPVPATSVPIPENLRLSYSQINTYLDCPLKYKYAYVYAIPSRPTAPLSFGTDIHQVLKEFYSRLKDGNRLNYGDLKKIYTKNWTGTGYEDGMQLERYKAKGFKLLEDFYNTNKDNPSTPLYIEEEFLIKIKGHRLKGFIDRIDQLPDGSVEVIDYKTGKPKNESVLQGNVQLNIYAIACQEVMNLDPSVLSLYYLEGNRKISIAPDAQQLDDTKQLILGVIDKVLTRDFPAKPGMQCKWCDFSTICPEAKA